MPHQPVPSYLIQAARSGTVCGPKVVLLFPPPGSTMPPLFDFFGTAPPGSTVELFYGGNAASPKSTVTADADGTFGFTGDSPAKSGAGEEWWVTADGTESNHIVIDVAE